MEPQNIYSYWENAIPTEEDAAISTPTLNSMPTLNTPISFHQHVRN